MTYVTDAQLLDAIRVICTSPVYHGPEQRVRCILATIDAHRPDPAQSAAAAEVPDELAGGA